MGIQYADLPRISTAGIEAGARSYDVLANSLDRMIDFAYQKQTTAAERKAKQYAIEFPPTKEQLQEAVKTGQFPKIQGAGDIFQRAYESTASQLLAAELQLNVARSAAAYQSRIEKREPVDPEAMRRDMGDMITGYASVLGTMNPDVGVKFRAANTSVAHDVYRQAVTSLEKQERENISTNVKRSVDTQRPNIRAIFANAGDISPDTGEPVPIADKLAVIEQVYLDYSRLTNDPKVVEAYYAMVEAEKIEALATSALQPEFAGNDVEMVNKVDRGQFGALQEVWDTLPPESQKKVRDRINGRLDTLGKARNSYLNQQNDLADSLEKQVYLAGNRSQQIALFNQMKTLTVDPGQIKRVQDFMNDAGLGAKVDNLRVLGTLNQGIESGTVDVDSILTARNNGQITASTARTLVLAVSNPNTALGRSQKQIRANSVIEREGMPEIISDKEAKSAAIVAENQANLELINFAYTPKADGTLPTSVEISTKGKELSAGLRDITRPMLQSAVLDAENQIVQFTLPQLAGVDLMDEAAVQARIDEILAQPGGEKNRSSVLSARNQITKYRELKRRIDQQ